MSSKQPPQGTHAPGLPTAPEQATAPMPVREDSGLAIFSTPEGAVRIAARIENGTVWLSQKLLAELYQVTTATISRHLQHIFEEGELSEQAVVTQNVITASDGKNYTIKLYNLEAIIHVGYRVRSGIGTLFRAWATERLSEYMVKGFTLDDERLKNPGPNDAYYKELLRRIRDIRTSEKRFYQQVRDLIAQTSTDYPVRKTEEEVQHFFASLQNKLLYAVTGKTAAELVMERACATKANMGLTTFAGDIVRVGDVGISKNYLNEEETSNLNDLVQLFLLFAEDRAKNRRSITLAHWMEQTDTFLVFYDRNVLQGKGNRSHAQAEHHAKQQYALFHATRKEQERETAETEYVEELRAIVAQGQKKI